MSPHISRITHLARALGYTEVSVLVQPFRGAGSRSHFRGHVEAVLRYTHWDLRAHSDRENAPTGTEALARLLARIEKRVAEYAAAHREKAAREIAMAEQYEAALSAGESAE